MNFKKRLKRRLHGTFNEYPVSYKQCKLRLMAYNRIKPIMNFKRNKLISSQKTTLKIHNGIQHRTFFEDIILFTHNDGMQKLFYYNGFTFYFYSTTSSSFIMFSPKSFRQGKIFYNTHFNENKARKIYLESI